MLDSSRVPGGGRVQAGRVELLLAEAVVEPDAGAGRDHPGAVAGREGHGARRAGRGRWPTRGRSSPTRGRRGGRGRRGRGTPARPPTRSGAWSSTSRRWPSTARWTRTTWSASSGVLLGMGEQEAQHRGEADPADRGWWRGGQRPAAGPRDERRPRRRVRTPRGPPCVSSPPRPVTSRLISSASSPWCRAPGPSVGDQLQRRDEVGHHDPAGGELAVGVVQRPRGSRRPSRRCRRGCSRGSSATPRSAGSHRARPRRPVRRSRARAADRRDGGPRRTPPASRGRRPSRGRW